MSGPHVLVGHFLGDDANGMRSRLQRKATGRLSRCLKCGPDGSGQCVGPNLCCGQDIGCMMGTTETAVCQQENQSLAPCFVRGETCGARDSGNCVADGICCDSESCAMNERCNKPGDRTLDGQTSKSDIIQLIHKLLRERDYD
ncbi:hypothetical protein Btru_008853 [Bulinus truncatus]|nr:hypothetical protein Btru_008853 [Bulinus truncatus]